MGPTIVLLTKNIKFWLQSYRINELQKWTSELTVRDILLLESIFSGNLLQPMRQFSILRTIFAELLEKSRLITESVKMLFQYALHVLRHRRLHVKNHVQILNCIV